MIVIDNNTFEIGIIEITRQVTQKVINRGVTLDLTKHYDVLGTYYDYEVTFNCKGMNVIEYDRLYEVITTPKEYFTVTLPYGQSTITFKARLSIGSDKLVHNYTSQKKWGSLKITLEALEPQKVVQ